MANKLDYAKLVLNRLRLKSLFRYFLLLIFLVIIVQLLILLNYSFPSSYDTARHISDGQFKTIQLITERFTYKDWHLGNLGEHPFRNCDKEKRCFVTKQGTFFHEPSEQSDCILVHGPNLRSTNFRRNYARPNEQVWVYFSMESQHHSYCSSHYTPEELDDWFNLTVTFRLDSSIVTDYRPFLDWNLLPYYAQYMDAFRQAFPDFRLKKPSDALKDELDKKKSVINPAYVLWLVSHCEAPSKRDDYVREMQEHIGVDIYGKCGGNFARNSPKKLIKCDLHKTDKQFVNYCLFDQYKFYLSFENSLCNEYVTEKYWKLVEPYNLFKMNIIPVVRGATLHQYKSLINIPNSYIGADAFKGPKELANYLEYLNLNQTAYAEYFKWKIDLYDHFTNVARQFSDEELQSKKLFKLEMPHHLDILFCELCSILHNETYLRENRQRRWKISEWFSPETGCRDKETSTFLRSFTKFLGFCS